MSRTARILIVAALAVAVAVVLVIRHNRFTAATGPATAPAQGPMPRLLELGSVTCRPCEMMAPILAELKTEYAGRLRVEFIDVKANPAEAAKYGVRLIPTQILFDASGQERWWHEGFISKQDMLDQWKAEGIDLGDPGQGQASTSTAPRGLGLDEVEAK